MEEPMELEPLLRGNRYPGRGILLGRSADGAKAVMAYFIMGRSVNSRNRVFLPTDDGIRTEAFDPEKLSDPSLIIYHPVRTWRGFTIVTNGDQTDTVRDFLCAGKSFEAALRARSFEPDAPNFTPRISGLMLPTGDYRLSILKAADAGGRHCARAFFEYESIPGAGHLLHTYQGDGSPLPSFAGEPVCVRLAAPTAAALADELWGALDGENRVSLFVRYRTLATGKTETVLRNKNDGD